METQTGLARSVKLGYATSVRVKATAAIAPPRNFQVLPAGRTARYEPLERLPISTDLVYGLMNVRTDGKRILCATMEEKGNDFDVKVIRARSTCKSPGGGGHEATVLQPCRRGRRR